MKSTRKGAS